MNTPISELTKRSIVEGLDLSLSYPENPFDNIVGVSAPAVGFPFSKKLASSNVCEGGRGGGGGGDVECD